MERAEKRRVGSDKTLKMGSRMADGELSPRDSSQMTRLCSFSSHDAILMTVPAHKLEDASQRGQTAEEGRGNKGSRRRRRRKEESVNVAKERSVITRPVAWTEKIGGRSKEEGKRLNHHARRRG